MSPAVAPTAAQAFSQSIEALVDGAATSVVRIDDGSRLTATGVVWSEDGVVVTTSHGVERDEDLAVETADGARLAATLVGRDPDTDIAVLRVQSTTLAPVLHAASDPPKVGSLVVALARPGRAGLHATLGIVTAQTETQAGGRQEYLLHTDADMSPGFSGGPLVDMDGRMRGMMNLMFGRGRGIAIGTPVIAHVVEALLANGRVQKSYLGIRTQQVRLPESVTAAVKSAQHTGLLIAQVEPGSPADKAGLLLGDTLLELGGAAIDDVDALRRELRQRLPGAEVSMQFLRGGEMKSANVVLDAE
jgi:S1-C subfamily serine protease